MTARLELAINKIYDAYNNERLIPECCKQCAVGNILDNTDSWKHFSEMHGSLELNYVGRVNEAFGRRFSGYLPSELLMIERVFLEACGYDVPYRYSTNRTYNSFNQDVLFKGLNSVIAYLCKLDGVKNVMDISTIETSERSLKTCNIALAYNHS